MLKILKSKFFIILMFAFMYLIFFSNSSKAVSTYSFSDSSYGTVNFTVPDNANTFVLFKLDGKFGFAYSNIKSLYCSIHYRWDNFKFYTDSSCSTVVSIKRAKYNSSSWNYTPVKQSDGTYLLDFSNATYYNHSDDNDFGNFVISNIDIYKNGNMFFKGTNFTNNPSFITTKEELESGKFEHLKIDAGDFDYSDSEDIIFRIYEISYFDENYRYENNIKNFVLNFNSSYKFISFLNIYYYIPFNELGIDFSNNKQYLFSLESREDVIYSELEFTVAGLTDEEEKKNYDDLTHEKMDEQTNAIKENTETNKGILSSIGDLLSYINPFSENFFVYKLIELLGNLLKSLFVPSSEFMSEWFTDISDYFEDAFGILYYPIDLVIQVLGRFDGITGEEPIITFVNLEFLGVTLIPAFTYNFNDILTTLAFKNIHDFYLITIDVILWLGLLVYCKNVCANIFGGKFTDDVVVDVTDYSESKKIEKENKRKSNYIGFRP